MKKIVSLVLIISMLSSPCFAFQHADLEVTVVQVPLATQLAKYYSGYEYRVTNISNKAVYVAKAQILNGQNGSRAFVTTMNNEPSAIERTWIIAGPVGLFTFGAGWVVGILATPIVAICSNSNKRKTKAESEPYSNILPLGLLEPNASIETSTLVRVGREPKLKMVVRDANSKELHLVQY